MQLQAITVCVVAALGVLSWLLRTRSRRARLQRLGQPPVMVPYWLPFGLDTAYAMVSHLLNLDFFEWARELMNNPGRTCELYIAGTRLIMTDDCDNIRAIMYGQFGEFLKGKFTHEVFASVTGDSVFSTDGDVWVANKNQLRPYLSKSRPSDFDVTETHVKFFLDQLDNGGEAIEVYDLVDRLQLDVVTHTFFGESTDTLHGKQQPFRDAMDKVLTYNTMRILAGHISLYFPDTVFIPKATRDLNSYMDMRVAETLSLPTADLEKRGSSITLMEALALQKADAKVIKNQLISVLLAGKDPVGITISWALYELARNPEVVKLLRKEIEQVCGFDAPPTEQHLKQMTLLKNIIRETLRLYHPLGFNVREAKFDTTIPRGGGPDGNSPVTILKGEMVAYSVMSLQRRHDIVGPTADEWLPSRYDNWQPQTWEFIPFNHGPRICLGRMFGYFQMEYVLCRIFQKFERIESGDNKTQKIKIELNTKMAFPVMCRFYKST
ncbi:hypothetical protein G647_00752 [Cladophialophora carrionii CBS 160.54]|uniref:Cytochrome P450 n=1 Tax=Cladophialophora carrionii CBS 160.54 TaxID=1279043 RepID=V9DPQ5_9EURO|nr:uncharacterized protein G647_00752 [Cladophialophora carrionii CBS 160.54]ETI28303.1 hypothetical protein G647_00752 [Cladophialophora carrionii CBS 160.54]